MTRRQGVLIVAAGLLISAASGELSRLETNADDTATVRSRAEAVRPLPFEANAGQFDSQARFVARTPSYSLFFTEREAVLSAGNDVVRLRFNQTSAQTRLVPVEPLAAKTNYLIGSDPSRWKTGISNYAKLRYEELYPGIDLVFYGNERELEYDLVVRPGINPGVVRLTLDGARDLAVDDNGDLVGRTTTGEMRLRKPVIYQRTTQDSRIRIDGRYRIDAAHAIAFDVAEYDNSRPLVIDPVVVYSSYLGGSEPDWTAGSSGGGARQMIAVDSTGAAYVAGTTNSLTFPTTAGAWQPSSPIATGFVTKIAPDGQSLVYSTFIGGTMATDECGPTTFCGGVMAGIAIDSTGHAYVIGNATSGDFPATPMFGTYSDRNPFLLKLSPSGSSLDYGILFGTFQTEAMGVAVDASGSAYITGRTEFDSLYNSNVVGDNAIQPHCNCSGGSDAFVVKFNSAATAVVYATHLGGGRGEAGAGIAVNAAGEAYVSGRTASEDFPTVDAAQPLYGQGAADDFVVKLNASGSALVFSTFLGGSGSESGNALGAAIAVDPIGNAYVTGYTESGNFPRTAGAFQVDPGPGPSTRAYATKYSPLGQMMYSTFLAGNGGSFGTSVAADAQGRAYLAGSTGSNNFPVPVDATQPLLAGGSGNDAYVIVLDPSGSTAQFATYLGGPSGFEYATGIALGPGGSIFVAGMTEGNGSFPTTPSAFQPNHGGGTEVFVTRINLQPPDTTPPVISAIAVDLNVLWPPNHTMRQVTVTPTVSDDVSAVVTCAISSITSNEPASGIDSGDLSPDWQDTAGLTTWLRAERDARRSGRLYTLTVSCTDEAGNASTRSVGVSVPVNQGK
jgi:hypothetical protein